MTSGTHPAENNSATISKAAIIQGGLATIKKVQNLADDSAALMIAQADCTVINITFSICPTSQQLILTCSVFLVQDGIFELESCVFNGSSSLTTYIQTPLIVIQGGTNIKLSQTNFSSLVLVSGDGAALRVTNLSNMRITDSLFQSLTGTAGNGGAMSVDIGSGKLYFTYTTSAYTFQNCSAHYDESSSSDTGNGGALYVYNITSSSYMNLKASFCSSGTEQNVADNQGNNTFFITSVDRTFFQHEFNFSSNIVYSQSAETSYWLHEVDSDTSAVTLNTTLLHVLFPPTVLGGPATIYVSISGREDQTTCVWDGIPCTCGWPEIPCATLSEAEDVILEAPATPNTILLCGNSMIDYEVTWDELSIVGITSIPSVRENGREETEEKTGFASQLLRTMEWNTPSQHWHRSISNPSSPANSSEGDAESVYSETESGSYTSSSSYSEEEEEEEEEEGEITSLAIRTIVVNETYEEEMPIMTLGSVTLKNLCFTFGSGFATEGECVMLVEDSEITISECEFTSEIEEGEILVLSIPLLQATSDVTIRSTLVTHITCTCGLFQFNGCSAVTITELTVYSSENVGTITVDTLLLFTDCTSVSITSLNVRSEVSAGISFSTSMLVASGCGTVTLTDISLKSKEANGICCGTSYWRYLGRRRRL